MFYVNVDIGLNITLIKTGILQPMQCHISIAYHDCIVTRTISTEMCEVVQHETEKAGELWENTTFIIKVFTFYIPMPFFH